MSPQNTHLFPLEEWETLKRAAVEQQIRIHRMLTSDIFKEYHDDLEELKQTNRDIIEYYNQVIENWNN